MEDKNLLLDESRKNFEHLGRKLFKVCDGRLFPADVLFLASCNRSIQVLDGFSLLMKNNNYSCGMALLRVQLDTVLRLYGITKTNDVHSSADDVINGVKLSNIKDNLGKKLQDVYLVGLLAVQNPWITHVYKLCSGYIHLSNMSFYDLIGLSQRVPSSTDRMFYIGSSDDHIEEKYKTELLDAFNVITNAVQKLTNEWIVNRHNFGTTEELLKKYGTSV